MEDILRLGCKKPFHDGINHLSTGAGFLPSTVVWDVANVNEFLIFCCNCWSLSPVWDSWANMSRGNLPSFLVASLLITILSSCLGPVSLIFSCYNVYNMFILSDLRALRFFSAQFNLCQKICDAQSTMEADDRPGAGSVRHSYSKYLRCMQDVVSKYYSCQRMKQATCLQRFGRLLSKHIMLDVEGAVQIGVSGKDGETSTQTTMNISFWKHMKGLHICCRRMMSSGMCLYTYIYIHLESEFVFRVFEIGELW